MKKILSLNLEERMRSKIPATADILGIVRSCYQVMPDLTPREYSDLKETIRRDGRIEKPIHVDEDGVVLDGNNRQRIAAELGIECPVIVLRGLSETEKRIKAIILNTTGRVWMLKTQRAAMGVQLLPLEEKLAKERQVRKPKNSVGVLPPQQKGTSRDAVARMVGISGSLLGLAKRLQKENPSEFNEMLKGKKVVLDKRRRSGSPKKNAATDIPISSAALVSPAALISPTAELRGLGLSESRASRMTQKALSNLNIAARKGGRYAPPIAAKILTEATRLHALPKEKPGRPRGPAKVKKKTQIQFSLALVSASIYHGSVGIVDGIAQLKEAKLGLHIPATEEERSEWLRAINHARRGLSWFKRNLEKQS